MRDTTPIDWALRPLRHYADFNGRSPRAEYWWFYLLALVLGFIVSLLDRALGTANAFRTVFDVALFVPWMAVTVRRLHDTDRSGWWLVAFGAAALLIAIFDIAYVGVGHASTDGLFARAITLIILLLGIFATFLIFLVLPGMEGSNRYGPDPYGAAALEEVFS